MKDIVNPANKWKSLDIHTLESYTSNSTVVTPKKTKSKKLCSIRESSTAKLPVATSLPTPTNRVQYTQYMFSDMKIMRRNQQIRW